MEPVLIYDDQCKFCRDTASWLKKQAESTKYIREFHLVPNIVAEVFCTVPELTLDMIRRDVHLIVRERKKAGTITWDSEFVYSGADAVYKALSYKSDLIWSFYQLPGFNWVGKKLFWLVKKFKIFYNNRFA